MGFLNLIHQYEYNKENISQMVRKGYQCTSLTCVYTPASEKFDIPAAFDLLHIEIKWNRLINSTGDVQNYVVRSCNLPLYIYTQFAVAYLLNRY